MLRRNNLLFAVHRDKRLYGWFGKVQTQYLRKRFTRKTQDITPLRGMNYAARSGSATMRPTKIYFVFGGKRVCQDGYWIDQIGKSLEYLVGSRFERIQLVLGDMAFHEKEQSLKFKQILLRILDYIITTELATLSKEKQAEFLHLQSLLRAEVSQTTCPQLSDDASNNKQETSQYCSEKSVTLVSSELENEKKGTHSANRSVKGTGNTKRVRPKAEGNQQTTEQVGFFSRIAEKFKFK
jgi:hypothetical protein